MLGYTIPQNLLAKTGLGKCRIYVQGMNLLTLSKYSGLDPDVTVSNITEGFTSKRDISLGVDYGKIPLSRQIIVGANLEF
jgi:TonB-dependent starch-binding outer membrane protein SusC